MMKRKDLYEGLETPKGNEKCTCGHSVFKSHVLKIPKNRYEPIKGKCKYCNCKNLVVA